MIYVVLGIIIGLLIVVITYLKYILIELQKEKESLKTLKEISIELQEFGANNIGK